MCISIEKGGMKKVHFEKNIFILMSRYLNILIHIFVYIFRYLICYFEYFQGQLRFIEENVNLTQDNCYYLFEMDHQNACSENSSILPAGLSVGSIIVIM